MSEPEKPAGFDFTAFERKLIKALDGCTGAVKHCGKNAIYHLEKAWALREIDFEMAVFRGITAEEEAASCLFYCLKNHQYGNASKLQFKEHTYKLGLFPFLKAVGKFLNGILENPQLPFKEFRVGLTEIEGRTGAELILIIPGAEHVVRPIPPLHFNASLSESKKVYTFTDEFGEILKGTKYANALKYVMSVADERNKLLYAHSGGRPQVEGDMAAYLRIQKRKIVAMLILVLMIDPWEKPHGQSLFVQQALDSYLLLLEKIKAEDVMKYPGLLPDSGA